jgi:hypothetical protein
LIFFGIFPTANGKFGFSLFEQYFVALQGRSIKHKITMSNK